MEFYSYVCVDCSAEEDAEGEELPGKDSPAHGRGEWKTRVSLQPISLDFALRFRHWYIVVCTKGYSEIPFLNTFEGVREYSYVIDS